MKLDSIFENKQVFSLEVFPPKKNMPIETIYNTLDELAEIKPDFISVTYGAGGSENCAATLEIASTIKQKYNIESVAHLPGINLSKEDVLKMLADFKKHDIDNILALRGDGIPDVEPVGDFNHADELVKFIKENGDFHVAGACYPEGHTECAHKEDDIEHLKYKVDCGVDFLTTQMFFDNNVLYNFLYRIREKGITVPVIAGIMPVTNGKQIARSCELSGTYLPARFKAIVDKFGDDPQAMSQAGIAYATEQIIDLIANGIKHIHIYSMNKPEIAEAIMSNLSYIIGEGRK